MKRIHLNDGWKFCETFEAGMEAYGYDDQEFAEVRLPHTVKELPFHYFDEQEYQMVSCYRKHFFVPQGWKGKRLLLTVDGAAHDACLYINGELVARHSCGYTAFTAELSEYVQYGAENVIAIRLDSRESLNVPPFGYVVDYMTYGGLTREVCLDVKEKAYIEDVFYKSEALGSYHKYRLTTRIKLCGVQEASEFFIRQVLRDGEEERLLGEHSCEQLKSGENGYRECAYEQDKITSWSTEEPKLYTLVTELVRDGKIVDCMETRIGFREAVFKADGFFLNGQKLRLRGLNRHQSYPYVGYAMPASMQRQDADILKYELGCNAVRTSHYPQSHHFIDRCDEIGLLVFTEMPGWQHIGNEAWKAQAVTNVEEMVRQYRNHTSIVLWGVRINESGDDEAFYRETNQVAHALDDSRATGGVRAHKKSQLLEDVYTYNDFVHNGTNQGCEPKKKVTPDMEKSYLVSEYNGHMYPTKAYDGEEHRVEHALRHAAVLNAVAGEPDIAGSFGWCMFDYNTHKDFGSGDRICYHGVMDMFRNPKLAALIYACQQEESPVLELSSTMDIGEHPACNRGDTYIFSNADSVRMYKNDRFIKEYKTGDSSYKNLKYGPILIDDFIGDAVHKSGDFNEKQADLIKKILNHVALHGYKFPPRMIGWALQCIVFYHMNPNTAVGLYNKYVGDWGATSTVYRFEAVKDGKVVKTIVKEPMHRLHIDATPSHTTLVEGATYDVAQIRLVMRDENDNQLYFYNDPVRVEVTGPIELIGPEVISFEGGMAGVYIRTTGAAGEAAVTFSSQNAKQITIQFQVEADQNK